MRKLVAAITVAIATVSTAVPGQDSRFEGKLEPFLGEAKCEVQQVFKGGRFPNIVVGVDGTVLAFWGGVKVRRSEDGGKTWGDEILVGEGFMGGGVTVNEKNGEILAFVEHRRPPADLTVYRSRDHGKTWSLVKVVIKPDKNGHVPQMHMNEHGITLRRGEHKGRLLRPARYLARGEGKTNKERWPKTYTTAVYSDDDGKTWQTSEPFPAKGTGEAAVAQLSDGRIYYNSRRHWAPEGVNARKRWTAWSTDGGKTWKDLSLCEVLPDGSQRTDYGCMGGLVRLPVEGRDILLYSNNDCFGCRLNGTVWASFDGGKTWPLKRLVRKGSFAYSSLAAGRPGTKSEGWIFVLFEPTGYVARFNLSWLLQGLRTGNGGLPKWVTVGSSTQKR